MSLKRLFTPKQIEILHQPLRRWTDLGGAVRSGKTHLQAWLTIRELVDNKGPYLATGKTTGSLRRNVFDPMRTLFGPRVVGDLRTGGDTPTIMIAGRLFYVICANDERAINKLQGGGYGFFLGDEVTTWPQNFFEMLKSRLDKPNAKAILTYNPASPYHWFKTDFIDKAAELDASVHQFRIDDNTFLDPAFVANLKTEYSGVWYQRYIEGLWTAADGLIYSMFRDEHIFSAMPEGVTPVMDWCVIDYGTMNAFVALIIALCSDGVFRVMREYRWDGRRQQVQKTDDEYVDDVFACIDDYGRAVQSIIVDPSAASFITALKRRARHPVVNGVNDVLDGIRYTGSLINTNKLLIHKDCEGLINEMHSYAWDTDASKRTGIDTPIKENDHGPDGLRYWAMRIANKMRIA